MERDEEIPFWIILNRLPEVGLVPFDRPKKRFNGKIRHLFSASWEELPSVGGICRAAAEHIAHWEKYFDWERE
jgi:hypothetical protein